MNTHQFKSAISSLRGTPLAVVQSAFNLGPCRPHQIYEALRERGVEPFYPVLTLLRAARCGDFAERERDTCRKAAEHLAGLRITRCRSAVPPYPPLPVRTTPRTGDARRFIAVLLPNPQHHLKARQRYDRMKVGRTIAEYLAQGGTARHLRECIKAGYVRIEG